ncbi:MAG: hypothetical protein QM757_16600 [Paludibaculum sp.]
MKTTYLPVLVLLLAILPLAAAAQSTLTLTPSATVVYPGEPLSIPSPCRAERCPAIWHPVERSASGPGDIRRRGLDVRRQEYPVRYGVQRNQLCPCPA